MVPPSTASTWPARRTRLAVLVGLVTMLVAGLFATPAQAAPEPPTTTSPTTTAATAPPPPPPRSRAEIVAELDVLEASSEEIQSAINQLDTRLAAERAAAELADFEVSAAEAVLAQTKAEVEEAEAEADRTADEVKRVAIEAYVHPPDEQMAAILVSASPTEARQRQSYLKSKAAARAEVLAARQAALDELERKRREAVKARDAAQEAADARDAAVASLEATRQAQQELADEIERKIAVGMAEVAALDAIDRQRAAAKAKQQAQLILAATRVSPPTTAAPAPTSTAAPPPTTAPPATPATTPIRVVPPPLVKAEDLRNVHGFIVHKSIETAFGEMIAASIEAGIELGGGAYRDPASQIATRKRNCGPTDYDIWVKPSGQCSPPTARPGTSMHEQGLAIDFTCSGSLITSRSGPCWNWLATHAADYGFYNLPSEPWHWSVNGH